MITKINLHLFKGFREYSVPLMPYTNVVGLNSRGKTSVLQGIKFVYDMVRLCFGSGAQPDFGNVRWAWNPSSIIPRYSLSEPAALWLNKDTAVPCHVELFFDNAYAIRVTVRGPNNYEIELLSGSQSLRNKELPTEARAFVQSLFRDAALLVPPLGATSSLEMWMNHQSFMEEANRGRHAETWRNALYWLYNDGEKDRYAKVTEFVKQYVPDARLLPPRLGHDHQPNVIIEFEESGNLYDVGLSGAGLRTLLNLASVLLLSDSRVILLDEPDSHLHSSLQRAISRMLSDFVSERQVQIIAATHAPDFLAETPLESIVWIDRAESSARRPTVLGTALAELGAISPTDAVLQTDANVVLFIEGGTDRRFLSKAFELAKLRNPMVDTSAIVANLPDGKSSTRAASMLPGLLKAMTGRPLRVACICDNDYELVGENGTAGAEGIAFTLPRKEIENYVIEPSVFSEAAHEMAMRRKNATGSPVDAPTEAEVREALRLFLDECREQVRCQLIWRYRDSLSSAIDRSTREANSQAWFEKNWANHAWRMRAVPGKNILHRLRTWCQKKYSLTVTETSLNRALKVPLDLQQALEAVSKAIYGA